MVPAVRPTIVMAMRYVLPAVTVMAWVSVDALPAVCRAVPEDHDQEDPESVHPDKLLAKSQLLTSSEPSVAPDAPA